MNNPYKFYPVLLLLALSASTAFGQRFHKTYPQVNSNLTPYRAIEVPGGFSIGLQAQFEPTFFRDILIDSTGHFLSATDVTYPPDIVLPEFIRTADGGALFFSSEDEDSVKLVRTDVLGNILWLRNYAFPADTSASVYGGFNAAIEHTDGFYLVGKITINDNFNTSYTFISAKIAFNGDLIWMTMPQENYLSWISNKLIINNNQIYFRWNNPVADPTTDYIGEISTAGVWSNNLMVPADFNGITDFAEHLSGGFVAVGQTYFFQQPGPPYGQITAVGPDGQGLWSRRWPQLEALCDFNLGGHFTPILITPTDNGWFMAGNIQPSSLETGRIFLAKLDSLGNITILQTYASPYYASISEASLIATADGGCLLAYYRNDNFTKIPIALKTDSLLIATPNFITGNIFQDQNFSCQRDTGEAGMNHWFVQVIHDQDSTYTTTNELGEYAFGTDTGAYLLKIRPFNPYWEACADSIQVVFTGEDETITADFPLQATVECPQMEVDVALPRVRTCMNAPLYIRYCNNGTIPSENTFVSVILDPNLDLISSVIPLAGQSGDTLYFAVGTVGIDDCGNFSLTVKPKCTTVNGQTLCVEAHVSPDTFCVDIPTWSGARIEAGGVCGQDSVLLWLKNTGTAPSQTLEFIVIEDIVVWHIGNVQLDPGEADTIKLPVNGATWRIESEQEPGYPLPGRPAAWVEGCGWDGALPFPGGFVTQFPDEDGNPAVSTDCRAITGSYDPNDKQASPAGAGQEHYILPGTPIEYMIRFQNTGNDTAFQVIIRDKLAAWLDPMRVQLGAASHPCRIELVEDGVLKFIFDNILLPDSTTNLAGSQGFVRFQILPLATIPLGTRIENTASIYFDFNQPIHTNTTWHVVDTAYFNKITDPVHTPPTALFTQMLSPNPVRAGDWVSFLKMPLLHTTLKLSDCAGATVALASVTSGKFQLPGNLRPGLYFWKMADGRAGKMVVF